MAASRRSHHRAVCAKAGVRHRECCGAYLSGPVFDLDMGTLLVGVGGCRLEVVTLQWTAVRSGHDREVESGQCPCLSIPFEEHEKNTILYFLSFLTKHQFFSCLKHFFMMASESNPILHLCSDLFSILLQGTRPEPCLVLHQNFVLKIQLFSCFEQLFEKVSESNPMLHFGSCLSGQTHNETSQNPKALNPINPRTPKHLEHLEHRKHPKP